MLLCACVLFSLRDVYVCLPNWPIVFVVMAEYLASIFGTEKDK